MDSAVLVLEIIVSFWSIFTHVRCFLHINRFGCHCDEFLWWLVRQIGPARFLLQLDCPDDVLVQRILARASTSGRSDDTEEITLRRIEGYKNETLPVVRMFEEDPHRTLFRVSIFGC